MYSDNLKHFKNTMLTKSYAIAPRDFLDVQNWHDLDYIVFKLTNLDINFTQHTTHQISNRRKSKEILSGFLLFS